MERSESRLRQDFMKLQFCAPFFVQVAAATFALDQRHSPEFEGIDGNNPRSQCRLVRHECGTRK